MIMYENYQLQTTAQAAEHLKPVAAITVGARKT